MEYIKPGTRCECRSFTGCGEGDTRHWEQCRNDAVRIVTVKAAPIYRSERYLPMCAACAEYHEAKASQVAAYTEAAKRMSDGGAK